MIDLNAVRKRAEQYAKAVGPGGEKAWHAGFLANDVPALLAEIERLDEVIRLNHDGAEYAEELLEKQRAEIDRLTEHSITLNTIAFAIAEALGDVPPDADRVEGNPIEQAQRLIADVTAGRQREALLVRLIADVPGTYPRQAHEIADEVRFILDKDGCRYCPPGCRSCLVDGDCECYDHQDAADRWTEVGA